LHDDWPQVRRGYFKGASEIQARHIVFDAVCSHRFAGASEFLLLDQ
jgi:hypothetical protein